MEHTIRHHSYDNIKGILMICVVFGHFLELCANNRWAKDIYLIIYSFHMPAFLFLSGYFSRYKSCKTLKIILLYAVFQILYCLFAHFVLQTSAAPSFLTALTTPYWILWYLPVLLYCQFLLPLWSHGNIYQKLSLFFLSICVSFLSGYWDRIGYTFSLSRFFVFLPFFLSGQLAGTYSSFISRWFDSISGQRKICMLLTGLSALTLTQIPLSNGKITPTMLYGSCPYTIGYHPGIRLQIMGIAVVWIIFLMLLANTILNRPIPFLSHMGANTLPVYLLHGFLVKLSAGHCPSVPVALLYTFISLGLLGNPLTIRCFRCLFRQRK